MKKIIVISRNLSFLKLNLEFYIMLNNRFDILFIEFNNIDSSITAFLIENKFKFINVSNYKRLNEILKNNKGSICLPNLCDQYTDWLLFIIFKFNKLKLVLISQMGDRGLTSSNKSNIYINMIEKVIFMTSLMLRYMYVLPKYDLLFLASKNKVSEINKYNKFRKIIYVNSYHFDQVLNFKESITEECIVFLDSNTPYHLDQIRMGLKLIEPKDYYDNLNKVFEKIEKYYNKKVVICAHPSFDMEKSEFCFRNRLVVKNKTLEYISQSKLVLLHNSTALNFAIAMRKPALLLDTDCFNTAMKHTLNIFYEELGINKTNFYKDENILEVLKKTESINNEKYDSYIENYLAVSKDCQKNSTSLIIDRLLKS